MSKSIASYKCSYIVDGSSIRVMSMENKRSSIDNLITYDVGIIPILPMVQIKLGSKFSDFMKALRASRIPIAVRKSLENDVYITYQVFRLKTGNVKEAMIGTVLTFRDFIIGFTFNREVLEDSEIRKFISFSSIHQMSLPAKKFKKTDVALKATQYISLITGVDREMLTVLENNRTLRVRVASQDTLALPVNYSFMKNGESFGMNQIAYNLNDAAKKLNRMALDGKI